MSLILIVIVLLLLFGGGGGYYAHRSYGARGLGGVLGIVIIVFILLWLFGGRQSARTLHWICANLIVVFVLVHVTEVFIAGVVNEVGSMITGRYTIRTGADH